MRFHQLWKAASLALVAVALLICPVARADGDAELIRARKLYAQGLTQEAAGDWAGALATFEDVARIRATPQVRFHLARCKEHLGRFNEALGGYRIAEYEAEQAASKEPTLLDEVRKARVALEGRIPKLTIARGKGAEAIRIELDGVALGDTQIGQPIALDPGPHVVTGIVERGKTFKKTLNVAEGDAVRVELDVPDELVEQPVAPPLATCLLYTSDAADERSSVDLCGRRIIKKKTRTSEVWPWIRYYQRDTTGQSTCNIHTEHTPYSITNH